jgi:hypothetical protein
MKNVVRVGLLACLLAQSSVLAISLLDDREAWHKSFEGARWEVDLAGGLNSLKADTTFAAGSLIFLPPDFDRTLSFDTDLQVINGAGWNNYLDGASGDPLLLASREEKLSGVFGAKKGIHKFGFEVLPSVSGLITLSLSDGSEISKFVEADGLPQFFGWVDTGIDEAGITGFTITAATGGMRLGNFVVPESGSTVILLGLGLLSLVFLRGTSVRLGFGHSGK